MSTESSTSSSGHLLDDSGYDTKWMESLIEEHTVFVHERAQSQNEVLRWDMIKNLLFTFRTTSRQLAKETHAMHDELLVLREGKKNTDRIMAHIYTEAMAFLAEESL